MSNIPAEELSLSFSKESQRYTVGTLKYNRRSVGYLFAWLLWGDFAFTFFESIFGKFIPLYLKDLNASNMIIGVMTGSLAGVINIVFLPNFSQWSDGFRSRLGRRIPFLLAVTPLTTVFLISVGFAPEISAWLHSEVISHLLPNVTVAALLLSLLCLCSVGFHFFNMVLVNTYSWLLRDVVPQALMSRFLSWFRCVGTVAAFLFLWYVFPTMIIHRRETFLLIGVFYLISFLLMCWKVKEGEYSKPVVRPENSNLFKTFGTYFRDCLSVPIYRDFFWVYILIVIAGTCAASFLTLYARHTLGLAMKELGQVYAYATLLSAIIYLPMGWLCEKFTAMRIMLISIAAMLVASILAYLFVGDKHSWLIYSLAVSVLTVGWTLGSTTVSMHLFPAESFGKFSSGINVFGCGGMIFGNYAIGQFMDLTDSHYRYVFIWSAFFYAAAIVPMLSVYRKWKLHGGPNNYVPPLPNRMLCEPHGAQ